MRRTGTALSVACLAFACLSLPAYAQAPAQQRPSNETASSAQVSATTRQFVEKAVVGDMYEIQSSRVVLDELQSKDFQDFAKKIADDHTKSSNEIKSIVQSMRGLQVPTQLDDKHTRMVDQLRSASGPDLARQYKSQQIQAHQDAVKLYQDYARQGDNPRLKQFAETTLPKLQEHQRMAQDLPNDPQVAQGTASDTRASSQLQSGAAKQQQPRQQQAQGMQPQIISRPGANHMMASQLRGTKVYGANDAHVGEINDVVLTTQGEIAAVVVGVGGFLGIGEKDVAIPFAELEIRESGGTTGMANPNQQTRTGDQQARTGTAPVEPQRILLRGMTKEELERAPNFRTQKN